MDLKPGKFILFFGLFSLIISIGLLYVMIFVLNEKENENRGLISVILMFIGFFSIGLYLTLHYYKYKIKINDKSMIINNEIGSKKEIYWNEIDKVSYNKFFNTFIVSCNKKKTWISLIYGHFIDFIPVDRYSEKLKRMIK